MEPLSCQRYVKLQRQILRVSPHCETLPSNIKTTTFVINFLRIDLNFRATKLEHVR